MGNLLHIAFPIYCVLTFPAVYKTDELGMGIAMKLMIPGQDVL